MVLSFVTHHHLNIAKTNFLSDVGLSESIGISPAALLSSYQNIYYLYKVCGHPFKLVDSAISATPIADRCVKSSTQPCNLPRQTLAVEWPCWSAQWLSSWRRHRMPPFQLVSLSHFYPDRTAPVSCKRCHCEVKTSRTNNGSAVKWKATQAHRTVPQRVEEHSTQNNLSSFATLATEVLLFFRVRAP